MSQMNLRTAAACVLAAGTIAAAQTAGRRGGASLAAATRQAGVQRDWPSWRGPLSTGAADSGRELVDSLEEARRLWVSGEVGLTGCGHGSSDHLATGFCDPIIADGRVYLYWFERSGAGRVEWERIEHSRSHGMRWIRESYRDGREVEEQRKFNADDVFLCLDAATGKTLWKRVFRERGLNHRKVYSPLCVPCVDGGRLYGLGSSGRVYCLDAVTGKPIWESDVGKAAEQFEQMRELCARTGARGFEPMAFNHAVIVADGVVVVGDGGTPLGAGRRGEEPGIVGFDAGTGRRIWQIPDCLHQFGTPSRWDHKGRQYVIAAGKKRMLAVEPRSGKVLWELKGKISDSVTLAVNHDYAVVNTNSTKDPNGEGPTCYRIDLAGATKLWHLPQAGDLFICLVGPVIHGRHAYVRAKGGLACVELATGKVLGSVRMFGHAYAGYVAADGLLFDHRLRVCKAWPDFRKLEGELPGEIQFGYIQTPAVADGRVYLRGRTNVYCYDFRKNPPAGGPSAAKTLPAEPDLSALKGDAAKLAALVAKGDYLTRAAAAELLREMGDKAGAAAPVLRRALADALARRDWGDTELILEALMEADPDAARSAAPDIAKLLDGGGYPSTMLACHALGLLGPDAAAAAPALTGLLKSADGRVVVAAARTLGGIGPKAAAAVPGLLALLEHRDEEVTYHAMKALYHVGSLPRAAVASLVDLAMAHPWVGRVSDNCVLPRNNSYGVLLVGLLGPEVVPLLLEKAQAYFNQGLHARGVFSGPLIRTYLAAAELVEAARVAEPASGKDCLEIVENVIESSKGKHMGPVGGRLKLMQLELAGKIDVKDPWGYGRAMAERDRKRREEKEAARKQKPPSPLDGVDLRLPNR